MIRISLPYFYNLSASLKPVASIQHNTPLKDSLYVLFTAENTLQGFLYGSIYSTALKACVMPGNALLQAIKKLTTDTDKERMLDFFDTYSLINAFTQFETVLVAEMNTVEAFFVTKKRGYDTADLIEQAEVLLRHDLATKVPEAVADIRQAGKCIAFEMPTAAGFHLMRALELVLRLYWDSATQAAERPKTNNMGDYLREMCDRKVGDPKVLACLKQIKDLHRNELIHPETTLDLDDAIGLLGICQSAITCMLQALPEKQLVLAAE